MAISKDQLDTMKQRCGQLTNTDLSGLMTRAFESAFTYHTLQNSGVAMGGSVSNQELFDDSVACGLVFAEECNKRRAGELSQEVAALKDAVQHAPGNAYRPETMRTTLERSSVIGILDKIDNATHDKVLGKTGIAHSKIGGCTIISQNPNPQNLVEECLKAGDKTREQLAARSMLAKKTR